MINYVHINIPYVEGEFGEGDA